jgi:anthranilate synthase component 1
MTVGAAIDYHALAREGFDVAVVCRTLVLDRDTPVSLFQKLGSRATFLLESADQGEATGRYSFLGVDRLWRISSQHGTVTAEGIPTPTVTQPLRAIKEALGNPRVSMPDGLPDFIGGAVGFVSYDYVRQLEDISDDPISPLWPDFDFQCPAAVVIVDHFRHTTTVAVPFDLHGDLADSLSAADALLDEISDLLQGDVPAASHNDDDKVATVHQRRHDVDIASHAASLAGFSAEEYREIVERAKAHIVAGDIFQVVPSQQFRQSVDVDPLTLYRILRTLNPSPYMYLLNTGDGYIVGASPEMLVRVENGRASTRPIAGTLPRGRSDAEDAEIAQTLRSNHKEIAEHVMLVDLGRNDLGRVCEPGTVSVTDLAHVEKFSHLMHLVTHVHGELANGKDAFDAFDAVFPAGTLSGAPKVRAMQIIDSFEQRPRGPYGGAVGYFSLTGGADFAITIRTISLREGVAVVQAGGGVVKDSDPASEYRETIHKASAPLLAIALAQR